jgi:hypothetical protein
MIGHGELGENFVAAHLTPAALAHQQVSHRHALGLPRTVEDHIRGFDLADCHATLERGAGESNVVRAL